VDNSSDERARLNQRLRQAFIDGAEVDMRRLLGRGLTAEELERVLRRYPGDLPEHREPLAAPTAPLSPGIGTRTGRPGASRSCRRLRSP
jgi:hypothetical protein